MIQFLFNLPPCLGWVMIGVNADFLNVLNFYACAHLIMIVSLALMFKKSALTPIITHPRQGGRLNRNCIVDVPDSIFPDPI